MRTGWKRTAGVATLIAVGLGCLATAQEPVPTPVPGAVPGPREGAAPRLGMRNARLEEGFDRWRETMQREDPAEFKRLMDLREKDPEAFRKEIRERVAKRGLGAGTSTPGTEAITEHEKACLDLARKFHETQDPAEAEKIKAQLQQAVAVAFDDRQVRQQERLTELETRIKSIREQVQKRQASKDKICQLRVEELTRDVNLNWGPE
jgi:hypothetical protein